MDELPNEILLKIFRSSLPVDQILLCKQVCKRWYWVVDTMIRLRSLVIVDDYDFPILSRWFEKKEFVYDYRYRISSRRLEMVEFRSNQPMFANLRRLFISNRTVAINTINLLDQLEVLEIKNSKYKCGKLVHINLPNLLVLCLDDIRGTLEDLLIEAPKLEKLGCNVSFRFKVKHPKSIKVYHGQFNHQLIYEFVNLEHLYCNRYNYSEETLPKLKNLKTLHFNRNNLRSLMNLKTQQAALKRKDPQIFFLGVHSNAFPLTELDMVEEWEEEIYPYDSNNYGFCINAKTIEFYGSNYFNLCDKLYYVKTIDYSLVESYFRQPNFKLTPMDLVKKLVALDELELSGELRDVEQTNEFVKVLKHCKYLRSLAISASMDQSFFDTILTENCPVIESLSISSRNPLNFDFLLKFSDLQNFSTKQQLSTDLVGKMFDKFEFLKTLQFRFKASSVEIRFYERTVFKLLLDEVKHLFNNLNSLLEYLKSNLSLEVLNEATKFDNFILNS